MLALPPGAARAGLLLLSAACGSRTPLEIDGSSSGGGGASASSSGGGPSGTPSASSSGTGGAPCPVAEPATLPMLWYPFDGDTRNVGFYGGGLFDGIPDDTSFIGGVLGQAIEIPEPTGWVLLPGTTVPMDELDAMTLVFWYREALAPASNTSTLSCRSFDRGFELYRGVAGASHTTVCWGAGSPSGGPGGCSSFEHPPGEWNQLLFTRTSDLAITELWLDGVQVESLDTGGFDLFAGAEDLLLGTSENFTGPGQLQVDDLRVYDVALTAEQRCIELGGAWCEDEDCTP